MCRSIKRLRTEAGAAPEPEITEAALQFVRKVSGFRAPSEANRAAFERAVVDVADASRRLLDRLPPKRPAPARPEGSPTRETGLR